MYPSQQLSKGFTLIELVMVIILLGIVSAIVLPRFFSTSPFSNANTLTELQSSLNYTRNRAVTSQCTMEFRIDSSGWSVLRDSDCDSNTTTPACPSDPLNFDTALIEASENAPLTGEASSANLQRLFFTPQGRLYRLTSGSGCTSLPASMVVPGITVSLTPTATLRLDGPTGYAALQ